MRIVSEETLSRFRGQRRCEFCGYWVECDPHHIYTRGAGRLDVPWNLIALCRWDHQLAHTGRISVTTLSVIVALRERVPTPALKEARDALLRLPKRPTGDEAADVLAGLSEPARRLVESALKEQE